LAPARFYPQLELLWCQPQVLQRIEAMQGSVSAILLRDAAGEAMMTGTRLAPRRAPPSRRRNLLLQAWAAAGLAQTRWSATCRRCR